MMHVEILGDCLMNAFETVTGKGQADRVFVVG